MHKLVLQKKARDVLDYLFLKDKLSRDTIINSLKDLEKKWIKSEDIKNIWEWIYRKRCWRWRILFTMDSSEIDIWIIQQEKDTKKDYNKRKRYILEIIKMLNK